MSSSLYRGKLYTNDDVKGPFTEAKDSLDDGPFRILAQVANGGGDAAVYVNEMGDGTTTVMFVLDDIWLTIDSEGIVEIGEGGA